MTHEQMVATLVLHGWRVWVSSHDGQGRDPYPNYCHPNLESGRSSRRTAVGGIAGERLYETSNFVSAFARANPHIYLGWVEADWFHPDVVANLPLAFDALMEVSP